MEICYSSNGKLIQWGWDLETAYGPSGGRSISKAGYDTSYNLVARGPG